MFKNSDSYLNINFIINFNKFKNIIYYLTKILLAKYFLKKNETFLKNIRIIS